MTDDLFTDQQDPQITDSDLNAYIGPGGKFHRDDVNETLKELAKAKIESDRYVKTLEQGRDQLREDYLKALEAAQTGPQIKELLDQLKTTPPATNLNANEIVNAPQLDPNKVKEMAKQTYQELEAQRKAEANYNSVEEKLKEAYGSDYRNIFQQKVREMGLSMDWAKQTAFNYPQVLFKTLGLDQTPAQQQFQTPPTSRQRTDNFAPHVEKRDWDYYEKLRVEKPNLYWNPKTQVQLHQDSKEPWFRTNSWNNS